MSNQDRLLSDEELQKSIEEIIITDDYSHGVQMRTINKMEKLIDTQKKLYAESDGIVLACPEKECNVAVVSSRQLSRWQGIGEITDPPHATTVWIPCEKHYQEGAVPFYTDKYGDEISADPNCWNELRAEQRKRIK